jgi:hypothetical protein
MAIYLTATFIDENGFATWLTPTVEIVEAETWVTSTHTMSEVRPWNYKYVFDTYDEGKVYFFNYDSNNDTILNRYQWGNNNEVKVVYQLSWGWTNASVEDEKKKEKEFIEKIIKEIKKEYPDYQPNIKEIKETLGTIVTEIKSIDTDINYWAIDQSIENSTRLIKKKIDWIKIPKYKEDVVISKITKEIKSIDVCDEVEDILEIVSNKERFDDIKKHITNRTNKELTEDDIEEMKQESLMNMIIDDSMEGN